MELPDLPEVDWLEIGSEIAVDALSATTLGGARTLISYGLRQQSERSLLREVRSLGWEILAAIDHEAARSVREFDRIGDRLTSMDGKLDRLLRSKHSEAVRCLLEAGDSEADDDLRRTSLDDARKLLRGYVGDADSGEPAVRALMLYGAVLAATGHDSLARSTALEAVGESYKAVFASVQRFARPLESLAYDAASAAAELKANLATPDARASATKARSALEKALDSDFRYRPSSDLVELVGAARLHASLFGVTTEQAAGFLEGDLSKEFS